MGQMANSMLDVRPALMNDETQRFIYDEFRSSVSAVAAGTPHGAPTGTAGDVNTLYTGDNVLQYHILGTQTIKAPVVTATGLNLTLDLTDDDGIELTPVCEMPAGTLVGTRGKSTYTVGTDAAFFFRADITITDVSGTDDLMIGFRKNELFQANVDDYDELAGLNVISGDINIETILNDGTTTTTDTTDNWADAASHTLTVLVSATGVVTYEIDGAAPTTTAAFTFDNGEVVCPFIFFLNASDIAETTVLTKWTSGFQGVTGGIEVVPARTGGV